MCIINIYIYTYIYIQMYTYTHVHIHTNTGVLWYQSRKWQDVDVKLGTSDSYAYTHIQKYIYTPIHIHTNTEVLWYHPQIRQDGDAKLGTSDTYAYSYIQMHTYTHILIRTHSKNTLIPFTQMARRWRQTWDIWYIYTNVYMYTHIHIPTNAGVLWYHPRIWQDINVKLGTFDYRRRAWVRWLHPLASHGPAFYWRYSLHICVIMCICIHQHSYLSVFDEHGGNHTLLRLMVWHSTG